MTAEISADLLARADVAFFAAFDRADSTADGVRAVVALVLAEQGDRFQWGVRRDGYRSVRVTSESRARFAARTMPGGGAELLRRRLGPWELVEYVPPRVREVAP